MLDAFLADTEIVQFDTAAFFADAVANPGAFGLENVTGQCVLNLGNGPGQCNPSDNRWLFWDGVHPATYAHGLIAQRFATAVPEPGSRALLTLGLVSVVATRRRRAR